MKSKLIILGSGNSSGVPRIDGYWGKCNKRNKKNYRTRCSAIILKGSNNIIFLLFVMQQEQVQICLGIYLRNLQQ